MIWAEPTGSGDAIGPWDVRFLPTMKIKLLVNPSSGRGFGRTYGRKVAAFLQRNGVSVEVAETRTFQETVALAGACSRNDCDILVAVGGDGTANAVANGLCRSSEASRPTFAVVPCGRGNDFAMALGLIDVETACRVLLDGARRRVDVGKTEAGFFLGVAGAGFDSLVARRAQSIRLLSGAPVYVYSVLRALMRFRPIRARIAYDSGRYEGPMMFAAVGNTDRYGGGMRIAPQASIEDGLLDLCLVKQVSRKTLLRMFPTVFRGTHVVHPQVFTVQTEWVTIELEEPAEVFADGEFLQPTPVRIEVVPRALEVMTRPTGSPTSSGEADHPTRANSPTAETNRSNSSSVL